MRGRISHQLSIEHRSLCSRVYNEFMLKRLDFGLWKPARSTQVAYPVPVRWIKGSLRMLNRRSIDAVRQALVPPGGPSMEIRSLLPAAQCHAAAGAGIGGDLAPFFYTRHENPQHLSSTRFRMKMAGSGRVSSVAMSHPPRATCSRNTKCKTCLIGLVSRPCCHLATIQVADDNHFIMLNCERVMHHIWKQTP